jgi:Arginase/agmatinase/formimionoglutamate hydrolase, arginase family
MSSALILDFDGSVLPLDGARGIPLRERQEEVRFACRKRVLEDLSGMLAASIDDAPAAVFLGSGDFHHVTLALLERLRRRGVPIEVVVFDNHPDNMRYPLGVHCGSWVWHASRLPFVSRVHVAGITSNDVEGIHTLENHLAPLRSGKVVYWCVQRDLRGLRRAGVRQSQSFDDVSDMLAALNEELSRSSGPVYLSIDKDVLSQQVVQTNWDQGVMQLEELESAVGLLRERLIGADVVGEVSEYRYRSRFKRLLSGIDRQPQIPVHSLPGWQQRHREVNARLLTLLTSHRGMR